MRKRFKDTALELAEQDENVVVAVGDISGFLFRDFAERFPDRFYNLGICENTLISVTGGLSAMGFHPFAHTIAPFLTERSFEQIKLDLCYNGFGGNIVTCGASFDYAWDGATHHCHTDLAILRMLPDMEVVQPGSPRESDALMRDRYNNGKPTYFRLSDHSHSQTFPVEFGKGVVVRDSGAGFTVVTAGPILDNVLQATEGLDVNVLYFHTLKPFDRGLLSRYAHTRILVVHDAFGLREAVNEVPFLRTAYHGLPDAFCASYGTVEDIRAKIGLDPGGIREAARSLMNSAGSAT